MTAEDAINVNGAKGRAIASYDEAQARYRAAREEVDRTREAVLAAGKKGSWPSLARSLSWPSSDETLAGLEALREASDALDTTRKDLHQVGLRPENWT